MLFHICHVFSSHSEEKYYWNIRLALPTEEIKNIYYIVKFDLLPALVALMSSYHGKMGFMRQGDVSFVFCFFKRLLIISNLCCFLIEIE